MSRTDGRDPPRHADRNGHVLLVDDDEIWSHVAGEILRHAGYRVSLATGYKQALEVLESDQQLDLMLVDIVMPKQVNGVALGRMARMRRNRLPLLYMTAYDIPGIKDETQDPVLRKPISETDLVSAVEHALAG